MKKVVLALALVGFSGAAFAEDVQKTQAANGTTVEQKKDMSKNPITGSTTETTEVTTKSAAQETSRKVKVKKDKKGQLIKKSVEEETEKK